MAVDRLMIQMALRAAKGLSLRRHAKARKRALKQYIKDRVPYPPSDDDV